MAIDLGAPGGVAAAMRPIRAIVADLQGDPAEGSPALRRAALVTRDELVLELSQPGTGRTYTTSFFVDEQGRLRVGPPRAPHTASAPGEPPAVDTGELRASIDYEIRGGVAYIGSGLEKANWLEHGYIAAWGTQVAPRPFMSTVRDRLAELLPEVVGEDVAGQIAITLRRVS